MKNFLCIFLCLMCIPWIVVAEDPALEEFDRQVSELLDSGYTQDELMSRISDADRSSVVNSIPPSTYSTVSPNDFLNAVSSLMQNAIHAPDASQDVMLESTPDTFTDITVEDFQIIEITFGEGIQATIKNNLSDTLDAVDLIVYYENVYGEKLGIIGIPQSYAYSLSKTIIPRYTYSMEKYGDYWYFTDMLDAPVRACVAVSRYHIKGGETVVIPEDEYLWTYWDI